MGSFIPVPNIDVTQLQNVAKQGQDVFNLLNTFSGGALSQFSIFAMGIMPYITASIIVQLLTMDVIPKFTEWAKEGENGRRKLAQITRYGTIVLGLIQAVGLSIGFNRMSSMSLIIPDETTGTVSISTYAMIAIVLTAGTAFLMWLGEQINEKGIGNGISILIFAGIIAGIPKGAYQVYNNLFVDKADALFLNSIKAGLLVIGIVLLIAAVIFVQQGVRKITVQYTKRVVGRKMYGGQTQHLPLKVNAAGVIPVIFALSLLVFPPTVASFFKGPNGTTPIADWIVNNMNYTAPFGMVIYVILILAFTFFYTFVQINPIQMAEQMKNNGGYILGIRPGKPTSTYISRVLTRITLAGAIFLAAISVLPMVVATLMDLPTSVRIGGTSLLIVIGVALETMKQVESQLIKRHYKGFISK
jgi:preprotein translocase subunit SecY